MGTQPSVRETLRVQVLRPPSIATSRARAPSGSSPDLPLALAAAELSPAKKRLARDTRPLPPSAPTAPTPSSRWLAARGLEAPADQRWKVSIGLDVVDPRNLAAGAARDTRLQILIERFEWSVFFRHGSGSSWIRVAAAPRVHEHDDFELLAHVTDLRGLGALVAWIEHRFRLRFRRPHAEIHTGLPDAHQKLLLWVVAAL